MVIYDTLSLQYRTFLRRSAVEVIARDVGVSALRYLEGSSQVHVVTKQSGGVTETQLIRKSDPVVEVELDKPGKLQHYMSKKDMQKTSFPGFVVESKILAWCASAYYATSQEVLDGVKGLCFFFFFAQPDRTSTPPVYACSCPLNLPVLRPWQHKHGTSPTRKGHAWH